MHDWYNHFVLFYNILAKTMKWLCLKWFNRAIYGSFMLLRQEVNRDEGEKKRLKKYE